MALPQGAHAGEILFSPAPVETDKRGRITAASRQRTTTELASVEGKTRWPLHLWADVEDANPGALMITLFGQLPDGRRYIAYRQVLRDYDGSRYVTAELELEGKAGLRRGHSYTVELSQYSPRGHLVKLAGNRLTLRAAGRGGESTLKPSAVPAKRADAPLPPELESSSSTTDASPRGVAEGPPPVETPAQRRGCSVARSTDEHRLAQLGLLGLLGLSIRPRRRPPA